MKTISELTTFYYNKLHPTIEKLEDERKTIQKRLISFGLLYGVVVVGTAFLFFKTPQAIFFIYIAILFIAGMSYLYNYLTKTYVQKFKQEVMAPLIHEIDENLNYQPTKHLPEAHFIRSKLFASRPDIISGNDLVSGKIDDVDIAFSDLHAQRESQDEDAEDDFETIFMGLFLVADFHKNFKGETIILPDSAQKIFGNVIGHWLQANTTSHYELIKMDNIAFEKEFVVYGSDQIEARYILSHTLMQKLLEYKQRSKYPLYISFVGGKIYMAIAYYNDMFEPSVFHSLLEYKIAIQYIQTLHLALSIVEELQLNQKLWSKI